MITEIEVRRELLANDVMSIPVEAVAETDSIWNAWNLALTKNIRHIAVVHGEHCVGVISDRQLLQAWQHGPMALRSTPVKRILLARTSCVLPDATLRQVAVLMSTEHVDAVPVVDESGRLLGLVTSGDIVHAVALHGLATDATSAAVSGA